MTERLATPQMAGIRYAADLRAGLEADCLELTGDRRAYIAGMRTLTETVCRAALEVGRTSEARGKEIAVRTMDVLADNITGMDEEVLLSDVRHVTDLVDDGVLGRIVSGQTYVDACIDMRTDNASLHET